MAENNFDAKPVKAKLKPGILPGVREIKRPDFIRRAEDIEKAEESRMQSLALEAGAEGTRVQSQMSLNGMLHILIPAMKTRSRSISRRRSKTGIWKIRFSK